MKRFLLFPACLVGLAFTVKAQVKDPPPPPPPKVELTKYIPPARELKESYKRNPDVSSLYWKSENDIVVIHKDKTQFIYNMKNKPGKDAFREKYGDVVVKQPPPPPPLPKKVS